MVNMMEIQKHLSRFGFTFERGGAHTARTMMLHEMETLLSYVNQTTAEKSDYLHAIRDDNCLGKRSGKTRMLTYRHMVDLYSLDRTMVLFRALLYLWNRDPEGRPLLALLCACARDPILRSTAPFILRHPEGAALARESLEEFIDVQEPGRFSKATLKSTAQNINATWTQSGHLMGRARKIRSRARPTAGSTAYALLLGYLTGARGQALIQTEYTKLLDCTADTAIALAVEASRKGWIVLSHLDDVIEAQFPNVINQDEMEWLREQR